MNPRQLSNRTLEEVIGGRPYSLARTNSAALARDKAAHDARAEALNLFLFGFACGVVSFFALALVLA